MSYIEFFGTIFSLWCVWLVAKNNILTWPVGMVGIVLFGFLFWQIQLYSDFIEQIYFFFMSIYGWWMWSSMKKTKQKTTQTKLKITLNSKQSNKIYVVVIVLGTIVMGYFVGHIDLYFPQIFPEQASFPYLDAFTTVMSFAATILMAKKKIECWYLWILVDVIGVGLYFEKDVVFVSFLYLIFLFIATKGYFIWRKELKNYEKNRIDNREIYASA
ncbi:MAG: nicotinamide mononucleotide transporter [Candidatus Pacebacteria bacterium]|nr:nicotinamide mononucleotide transporter [Candidatus Paceibacterota bacterium]